MTSELTIETIKDAVSYIRNENKRMEEDDYLFYEEAIKIVCKAALKWCEYSVGSINEDKP